jgi:hypothetical protein
VVDDDGLHIDLRLAQAQSQLLLQCIEDRIFCITAVAAFGSIMISWEQRGDVEVTEAGVRRIFAPGREQFFPREEIAGLVARVGGGVTLVDERWRRKMVVPRSIVGYRECIAELKGMGIQSLPAWHGAQARTWKQMTWKERIQQSGAYSAGSICFSRGSVLEHCVSGAICMVFFAWMAFDHRRDSKLQPVWCFPR